MQWSNVVADYHPVFPEPRWGYGKPVHGLLKTALEKSRDTYANALAAIGAHRAALHTVGHADQAGKLEPFWSNAWFSCLDAASLVGFMLERKPVHYMEIGSGHSTRFARHAVRFGKLATKITSLDPAPHHNVDRLCDTVVRLRLELCDPAIFRSLGRGDILFFDGSHRVFTNSDVTTFFFDVLPNLSPGVLVHIHDIFLPYDYPPQWNERLYSEQYLLGAMLLCPQTPFRIILPNHFACNDAALADNVKQIFRADRGQDIPFAYDNDARCPGVSFWLETV